jgi:hypothetical protein
MAIDPQGWWNETLGDDEGKPIVQPFPVVIVSAHVHEMIYELEMAISAAATCPKEELGNAYAHVGACRATLYRYVQSIEQKARVKRKPFVIKRF